MLQGEITLSHFAFYEASDADWCFPCQIALGSHLLTCVSKQSFTAAATADRPGCLCAVLGLNLVGIGERRGGRSQTKQAQAFDIVHCMAEGELACNIKRGSNARMF